MRAKASKRIAQDLGVVEGQRGYLGQGEPAGLAGIV